MVFIFLLALESASPCNLRCALCREKTVPAACLLLLRRWRRLAHFVPIIYREESPD